MERCLQEFRIRGVKTNIPFLIQMIGNEIFLEGKATTRLIDTSPNLFEFKPRKDRATRILKFLANTIVNGNPLVKGQAVAIRRDPALVPATDATAPMPTGTRDLLKSLEQQPNGPFGRAAISFK